MTMTIRSSTLLLIFVTLTSVTAQTFQYSRGWINGKRSDHKRNEDPRDLITDMEKVFTPCQLNKLKYILEGKPLSDKLFVPCDYVGDDVEIQPKRYRIARSQEPVFDGFL